MAETSPARIITLTINPAVDISTSVRKLAPYTKMRCAPAHRDPGGGGINVARVLKRLGIAATAVYPAGGATGQLLETLLEREGVRSLSIPVELTLLLGFVEGLPGHRNHDESDSDKREAENVERSGMRIRPSAERYLQKVFAVVGEPIDIGIIALRPSRGEVDGERKSVRFPQTMRLESR